MHLVLEAIPFVCLVKLPFDTTFPIQVRFSDFDALRKFPQFSHQEKFPFFELELKLH